MFFGRWERSSGIIEWLCGVCSRKIVELDLGSLMDVQGWDMKGIVG